MSESYIEANGIRLAYEEFGRPSAPGHPANHGPGHPDDQLAPVSL